MGGVPEEGRAMCLIRIMTYVGAVLQQFTPVSIGE